MIAMEFTTQDTKLIERLRKRHRQWRWIRWVLLANGVLYAALCVACGYLLSTFFRGPAHRVDSDEILGVAVFWTNCLMFFVISTWSFVTAALKWRGDPTQILLLRLLDTQTG